MKQWCVQYDNVCVTTDSMDYLHRGPTRLSKSKQLSLSARLSYKHTILIY